MGMDPREGTWEPRNRGTWARRNSGTEEPGEPAEPSGDVEWRARAEELLAKGFRPYLRTKPDGARYITVKRGRFERGLGPYSDERWRILNEMAGEATVREGAGMGKRAREMGGPSLLTVRVEPPPVLSKSITINPKTLMYYTWMRDKGYEGSLSDFLNGCVEAYFKSKGIEPVMYREVEE